MLAVPLDENDVASSFCSAEQFAIAKLDGGRAHRICRLTIRNETDSKRLECLSVAGVKVLLCGSFDRSLLPHAEALGIRVISGLAGEAERLFDAFARGEIEQQRFLPSGKGGTARYGRGVAPPEPSTGASITNRRRGVEPCRTTTEPARWGPDRGWGEALAAADDPRTAGQQ